VNLLARSANSSSPAPFVHRFSVKSVTIQHKIQHEFYVAATIAIELYVTNVKRIASICFWSVRIVVEVGVALQDMMKVLVHRRMDHVATVVVKKGISEKVSFCISF
jgi:hypothetical protein